jgi:hypothetical protein
VGAWKLIAHGKGSSPGSKLSHTAVGGNRFYSPILQIKL